MIKILLNTESARQIGTVVLGGTSYRIRAAWRDRLRGWYIDLQTAGGVPIVEGMRVSAGGLIARDLDRLDEGAVGGGVLLCAGRDKYVREDFGVDGGINLYYLTREEFDAAMATVATPEDVRITD
jgi:hypothetical protein